ncbi:VacJ family lipoprotein [Thermodesulfobacteriota bacterium]
MLSKHTINITALAVVLCVSAGQAYANGNSAPASLQRPARHTAGSDNASTAAPDTETASTADEDDFYDPFSDDDDFTITDDQIAAIADPLQGYNRVMFVIFIDKMYFYILKPAATGLSWLLPESVRRCMNNFFLNIGMPVRFFNCLFQLKLKGAGVELSRFVINTTLGIVGLFDPAHNPIGLNTYLEDTGQTFGHYRMGPGFYFVLPIFGPSSGRDSLGLLFDLALNPTTYIPGALLLKTVNSTSLHLGEFDDLKKASVDPYIALRNAYAQNRDKLIEQ